MFWRLDTSSYTKIIKVLSGRSRRGKMADVISTDGDPVGAMRFTIAVVLVYGVGVIGLLGITARRNRRTQLMDKEVNHFIRTKLANYNDKRLRNKKGKSTVSKLITSFHNFIGTNHDDNAKSLTTPKYSEVLQSGNIHKAVTSNEDVEKLLGLKKGDNVFRSLSPIPEITISGNPSFENLRETDSACEQGSTCTPKKKKCTEIRSGQASFLTVHHPSQVTSYLEEDCK